MSVSGVHSANGDGSAYGSTEFGSQLFPEPCGVSCTVDRRYRAGVQPVFPALPSRHLRISCIQPVYFSDACQCDVRHVSVRPGLND